MPCQGDSKSRCAKDKLGGILFAKVSLETFKMGPFGEYCCGCIMAKSIPTTSASLYLLCAQYQHFVVSYNTPSTQSGGSWTAHSAISIAHIPVPVPKSKIRGPRS